MSTISATSDTRLSLIVNGDPTEVAASTLQALLVELGFGGMKVATAVNGDFVPERRRGETALNAGDKVEIVAPRQGG